MFTAGRPLPIAPLLPALLALAASACAAGGQSDAPPGAATAIPVRPPAVATALIEWLRPATLPGISSPPPAVPGPVPAAAPRQRVAIDLGGLWVGPENPQDGPRAHYLFARRQRAADLMQLVRDYAPFRVIGQGDGAGGSVGGGAGASELVFRGRGAAQASAAERRMIGEWTRAVMVEAAEAAPAVNDAGSPSPFGLAFAWHRGVASGGICDDLVVYLTGEVRAGSCGSDTGVAGRLTGERLQRLYAWIDGLAAFQDAGEQELRADALLDRLIFAGRGRQRATPRDIAAIEAFAGSLHRELTAAAPAAPSALAVAAAAIPRTAAAVRKTAPPPQAEQPEDAVPDDEAAAVPAEGVPPPPPRKPRPRKVDVAPEPDEAPPPPADAVSPPPPQSQPAQPAQQQPPQSQPAPQPRERPVAAAPAPEASPSPPAEGPSSPPPSRRPPRKRPVNPAPPPEAPPPPPPAA